MKIEQFWVFLLMIFLLSSTLLFFTFVEKENYFEITIENTNQNAIQAGPPKAEEKEVAKIFEVIKDQHLLEYLQKHPYKPHVHAEDEDEEQYHFNSHQDLLPYEKREKIEELIPIEVEKAKISINVGVNVENRKNINVNVQIDGNNAPIEENMDINVNINFNEQSSNVYRSSSSINNNIQVDDFKVNVQVNEKNADYVKINNNINEEDNNNNDNLVQEKALQIGIVNNKNYLKGKYIEGEKNEGGDGGFYYNDVDPFDVRIDEEVLKASLKHFRDANWEQSIQNHFHYFNESILNNVPKVIFYNRIGKAGSTSLISWLSAFNNNFNFQHSRITDKENESEENFFKDDYKRLFFGIGQQNVLERHIYYVNFTRNGFEQPDYINMMREPSARYISQYYFWRGLKTPFGDDVRNMKKTVEDCLLLSRFSSVYGCPRLNYQTSYFCGHDPICDEYPLSYAAYLLARENLVNYYAHVGILEYFQSTTSLLMSIYPTYFNTSRMKEKYVYGEAYYSALQRVYHPELIFGKKQSYPPSPKETIDLANYLNYFDYKLYQLSLDIMERKAHLFNIPFER